MGVAEYPLDSPVGSLGVPSAGGSCCCCCCCSPASCEMLRAVAVLSALVLVAAQGECFGLWESVGWVGWCGVWRGVWHAHVHAHALSKWACAPRRARKGKQHAGRARDSGREGRPGSPARRQPNRASKGKPTERRTVGNQQELLTARPQRRPAWVAPAVPAA